jgi:hypothetical protein
MDATQESGRPSGTIGVGATVTLTLVVGGAPNVSIAVKNTGDTNDITAMTLAHRPVHGGSLNPSDADANTDLVAAGDLAPGQTRWIALTGNGDYGLELALTSTSGTTYAVEWSASR